MDCYKNNEFKALCLRYNDHVELMREMTRTDIKMLFGYITLQLLVAGWLVNEQIESLTIKIGLFIIDFSLAFITTRFLYNNYRRRQEVVNTLKNINDALGFNQKDIYLKDAAINSPTKFRPYFAWFLIGVFSSLLGLLLILFIGNI